MKSKKPKQDVVKFDLNYMPTLKQQEMAAAIERGARYILFRAGVRSGKTYGGVMECLKQIYKYQRKPNLGWIVSPTYDMMTVAERKFVDFCSTPTGSLIVGHNAQQRAYYLLPPPSMPGSLFRVEFKTAMEPKHLRGRSCAWILLDEAAAMKKGSEVFSQAKARVLDSKGIIIITSSPIGQNWMYHDVYLPSLDDPEYADIQASTYDNPYLPQEEVAKLEADYKRYSENFARQEIHGSFETFEGLVFNQFNPDDNIIKYQDVPDGCPVICGIDWGQNDPFVCVWLTKVDGAWIVVDEYYKAHGLNSEHFSYIKNHPLFNRVRRYWCDPSNAQQRREFRALGLPNLYAARRPKLDPKQDWPIMRARLINNLFASRVKSPFKSDEFLPALTFYETIRHGRREVQALCFENYTEEIKDDKGKTVGIRQTNKYGEEIDRNAKEKIEDKNNHFVDALGYALFSECRTGPELHPYYWDESAGRKVIQAPKETKQEVHKRMMREQFWDAIQRSRVRPRRTSAERYDPTIYGEQDDLA